MEWEVNGMNDKWANNSFLTLPGRRASFEEVRMQHRWRTQLRREFGPTFFASFGKVLETALSALLPLLH